MLFKNNTDIIQNILTLLILSFILVIATSSELVKDVPKGCVVNATSDQKPDIELFTTECINLQVAARLKIGDEYILLQGGKVPQTNKTVVDCSTPSEEILIDFPCGHLNFKFYLDKAGKMLSLESIAGAYNIISENKTSTFDLTQHKILEFPESTNYRCTAEQSFNVTIVGKDMAKSSGLLMLSNLKIDAFRPRTNNTFDLTTDHVCNLDSSDLVPTVVFICLVSMIVVVLVVFFVGRRRWSERSSYESV